MVEEYSDFLIVIFSGAYRGLIEFRFRGSILYLLTILNGLVVLQFSFDLLERENRVARIRCAGHCFLGLAIDVLHS